MASVADKIHTILEAAEATAAAIRHEAEADAERAARERRRREDARDELSHLSRLADALSVQAEAVSRQCDIVARVLLTPKDDVAGGGEPAERGPRPVEEGPVQGQGSALRSDPAGPTSAEPGAGHQPAGPEASAESAGASAAPTQPPPEGVSPSGEATASAAATATSIDPPASSDAPAPRPDLSDASPSSDGALENGERLPSSWVEAYRMRLAGAEPGEVEAHLRRTGADDPSEVVAEVFRDERPGHT